MAQIIFISSGAPIWPGAGTGSLTDTGVYCASETEYECLGPHIPVRGAENQGGLHGNGGRENEMKNVGESIL
jgi:hypothetical protein